MKVDNELIAEFMGLKSRQLPGDILVWYKDDPNKWFSFPDYSRWSSLMPVVDKIKALCVTKSNLKYSKFKTVLDSKITISIEILYMRIVAFIKWYNTQPK